MPGILTRSDARYGKDRPTKLALIRHRNNGLRGRESDLRSPGAGSPRRPLVSRKPILGSWGQCLQSGS